MGGKRKPVGDTEPRSVHTVNGVVMERGDWARIKEWCYRNDMRIGVLAGKALEEWMEREGI